MAAEEVQIHNLCLSVSLASAVGTIGFARAFGPAGVEALSRPGVEAPTFISGYSLIETPSLSMPASPLTSGTPRANPEDPQRSEHPPVGLVNSKAPKVLLRTMVENYSKSRILILAIFYQILFYKCDMSGNTV